MICAIDDDDDDNDDDDVAAAAAAADDDDDYIESAIKCCIFTCFLLYFYSVAKRGTL